MAPDIAAVVNLHREGTAAIPSLVSALRAKEEAENMGQLVELLIVLDRADEPTRSVANDWVARGATIVECDEGDLGAARNTAASATTAEFVAFLDGDDLWGPSWLLRAARAADKSVGDRPHVFHPEINVIFGDHHSLLVHRPSDHDTFSRNRLRLHNMWTALSFMDRKVLLDWPYPRNRLDEGFGYEDWSWNLAIIDAGGSHHVVADTCHFIRRTDAGSLLANSQHALRAPYSGPLGGRTPAGITTETVSTLTPTDEDLPATHRRVQHGLSDEILSEVRQVATIEPAITTTVNADGLPRSVPVNHNDHVTPAQRALEAIEVARHQEPDRDLVDVLDHCEELASLDRATCDRVVAEVLLDHIETGASVPDVDAGPIADALATFPQLR